MNPLELAAAFVEDSQQIQSFESLIWKFHLTLERLGFRYYACGSHVDPLHADRALMLLNYPREWVQTYSERQLHRIDPVFLRAEHAFQPFHWKTEDFLRNASRAQQTMLREAHRFGLSQGFTIPVHAPAHAGRLRGSCTLIPDAAAISSHHYLGAQLIASALFAHAVRLKRLNPVPPRVPALTPRQLQCLQLLANGNKEPRIAQHLGLSINTVHRHLEEARLRLNVDSRAQLLLQACLRTLISTTQPKCAPMNH
jgi:LuxR family quorum-sensing system transcriptional regulator CciR